LHYASWFEAGRRQVRSWLQTCGELNLALHYASWFEAGRIQVRSWLQTCGELKFGLSSSLLTAN